MTDRGPRYWLEWPHTRQDHVLAFVAFFAITVAAGYTDAMLAALVASIATLLLGIRLLAWKTGEVGAGEGEGEPDLLE